MNFSITAIVLWAAGLFGNATLLFVLVARKRFKVVPWFTTWVVFNITYTLALYGAYRLGTRHLYVVLYWSGAFLDLLLQLSVVLEIAGYVFRRGGSWVGNAKARLMWAAIVAGAAGVVMGSIMTPVATSRLDALESRLDLGATVLIAVLFTSIMVVSHQLGVSWRSIVLREGYGVAAWSMVSFFTDTLHAYWRTAEHFRSLENIRISAYLAALGYWCLVFWIPEPEPLVLDDVTKRGIESMRERLESRE